MNNYVIILIWKVSFIICSTGNIFGLGLQSPLNHPYSLVSCEFYDNLLFNLDCYLFQDSKIIDLW